MAYGAQAILSAKKKKKAMTVHGKNGRVEITKVKL